MRNNNIRATQVYHDYYARLKGIALSMFQWEGLPSSCSERFLEDTLFHYGKAIFLDDPELGFLNLRANVAGELNHYNEPLRYQAFSTAYNREVSASECVIIRNNYMERSTDSTIMMYAERLANLELAIQVNINAQKTPVLIKCDEKMRLTLENLYRQYSGNMPFIFGLKNLQERPLDVLTTGAPFVADKLREEKRAVWNEALEFLGFNTNPSEKKKERLIVNEVDANNEQIGAQRNAFLVCREVACEQINDMYGLDVSVSFRIDESPLVPHQDVGVL